MNKLQQRGQGGFTLVELLVVIAILAILAGVVVFAVGSSTDNAKTSACQAEARAFSTAANATKAALLTEPGTIDQTVVQNEMNGFLDGTTLVSDYFTATVGAASPFTITIAATTGVTLPAGCTAPAPVNAV